MNKNKIKTLTYLAGGIEHCTNKEMKNWREEVADKLASPDLVIYDPVSQESAKVGKPSGEQVNYIKGLKQAGHWDKFKEEMQKIWWGSIKPDEHIYELFMAMRTDAIVKGNFVEDLSNYGDYEAVARSEFIIVYLPKDTRTVGTIYEIMLAFLFHIPIYLILPDHPKTECNSSLLYGVMISGGEVFYSVNEACKFIKEKYKLKENPKVEEKKEDPPKKEGE